MEIGEARLQRQDADQQESQTAMGRVLFVPMNLLACSAFDGAGCTVTECRLMLQKLVQETGSGMC